MGIDELMKHEVKVNFLTQLGKNSNEIFEMVNTLYGDDALKKTTMSKLIMQTNKDCKYCKDNMRLRHPFTSCNDKNIELVWSRVLSMIADELNIKK